MVGETVHTFDNNVKVFKRHLLPAQLERYAFRNVHEAEEEDIFVELIAKLPLHGVYINIGSAIGYYVILTKKMRPDIRIIAIEPLELHREYFVENIKLNGLAVSDFEIMDYAISAINGEVYFLANGYGSMIDRESKQSFAPAIGKKIQSHTLDAILEQTGYVIDLCQMDVQGTEVDILYGSVDSFKAGKIKSFLIGTHGENVHQKCIDILVSANYSINVDVCFPRHQPDGIVSATLLCNDACSENHQ